MSNWLLTGQPLVQVITFCWIWKYPVALLQVHSELLFSANPTKLQVQTSLLDTPVPVAVYPLLHWQTFAALAVAFEGQAASQTIVFTCTKLEEALHTQIPLWFTVLAGHPFWQNRGVAWI